MTWSCKAETGRTKARFLFQNVKPLFFSHSQRLPWAGLVSKELIMLNDNPDLLNYAELC
jgi:hypothetical protein